MNYYTKELTIDEKWDVSFQYTFRSGEPLRLGDFDVDASSICVVEYEYLESQIEKWLFQELQDNYDKYLEDEILVDSDKKLKYSKENEE